MKKIMDFGSLTQEQQHEIAKVLGVEVPEGSTTSSHGALILTIPEKPVHLVDVIELLRALLEQHGNLPVAIEDQYGRLYGFPSSPTSVAVRENMVAKPKDDCIWWDKAAKPSPKLKYTGPWPTGENLLVINPASSADEDDDDDFDDEDEE